MLDSQTSSIPCEDTKDSGNNHLSTDFQLKTAIVVSELALKDELARLYNIETILGELKKTLYELASPLLHNRGISSYLYKIHNQINSLRVPSGSDEFSKIKYSEEEIFLADKFIKQVSDFSSNFDYNQRMQQIKMLIQETNKNIELIDNMRISVITRLTNLPKLTKASSNTIQHDDNIENSDNSIIYSLSYDNIQKLTDYFEFQQSLINLEHKIDSLAINYNFCSNKQTSDDSNIADICTSLESIKEKSSNLFKL